MEIKTEDPPANTRRGVIRHVRLFPTAWHGLAKPGRGLSMYLCATAVSAVHDHRFSDTTLLVEQWHTA